MKGLFVKDLKLMSGQKKFLALVFLLACVLLTTNSAAFVINYLTILCSILVVSTISYDEFDNGNAFLFTLPISRKEYVREKYLFGFGVGIAVWFLTVLLIGAYLGMTTENYNWMEGIATSLSGIFTSGYLLSFLIPVQLKFGAEKGRLVLISVSGIIGVICFGAVKMAKKLDIDMEQFVRWLKAFPTVALMAGLVFVFLMMVEISYLISVKVMEKKEF